MKDTSRLTKKQITDRTGKRTTVWVKTGMDAGKKKHESGGSDDSSGKDEKIRQAVIDRLKDGKNPSKLELRSHDGPMQFSMEFDDIKSATAAIHDVNMNMDGIKAIRNTIDPKKVLFVRKDVHPEEVKVGKELLKEYKENEQSNSHTENLSMLAHVFGEKSDMDAARKLKYAKENHITLPNEDEIRSDLEKKASMWYKQLLKRAGEK